VSRVRNAAVPVVVPEDAGVTEFDAVDGALIPKALLAVTVQV